MRQSRLRGQRQKAPQAPFNRTSRGFEVHAGLKAALNMLAAGYAVSARGAERARTAAMKQKPAMVRPGRAATDRNAAASGGGGRQEPDAVLDSRLPDPYIFIQADEKSL